MAKGGVGRQNHESASQRQLQLQNERTQIENDLAEQRELEGLDQAQDMDSERAAKLQPHLGNQAIQDLLDRLQNVNDSLTDLENTEEQIEEKEDEFDLEEEMQSQGFGGGDGGAGATSENPWEMEVFYGGDDDNQPKKKRVKRLRRSQNESLMADEEEKTSENKQKDISRIDNLLPRPQQGKRTGDAVYKAVEVVLQDPRTLFGDSLDPQDLAKRQGVSDPIRAPVEIGRFMARNAQNPIANSIGKILGGPVANLVTPQGGFSTAVARLATLAVCAEAAEAKGEQTDRAVSLSLRRDTWSKTVEISRQLAQKGQLHAPTICATVFGRPVESEQKLPAPSVLGGAALGHILPKALPIPKPYLAVPPPPEIYEDETLSFIDATLAKLTGGPDPNEYEPPTVDQKMLTPALISANQLLNALGRAQVEFGAAAIAIKTISPHAAVQATLRSADSALRQLARATVIAGRQLESFRGKPHAKMKATSESPLYTLQETAKALDALKTWGFSTLAGAMDQIHE